MEDRSMLTADAWDSATHATCFASDLRLAPGEWPRKVWFEGRSYRLVEVVRDREGEVTHAEYDDSHGVLTDAGVLRMTVWND